VVQQVNFVFNLQLVNYDNDLKLHFMKISLLRQLRVGAYVLFSDLKFIEASSSLLPLTSILLPLISSFSHILLWLLLSCINHKDHQLRTVLHHFYPSSRHGLYQKEQLNDVLLH
jgi:hypothetical protein